MVAVLAVTNWMSQSTHGCSDKTPRPIIQYGVMMLFHGDWKSWTRIAPIQSLLARQAQAASRTLCRIDDNGGGKYVSGSEGQLADATVTPHASSGIMAQNHAGMHSLHVTRVWEWLIIQSEFQLMDAKMVPVCGE